MDDATRGEAGRRCFEILTSILEEHDDMYLSLACTGRLLARGGPVVAEEAARVIKEWKQKDPRELTDLVDLLPVNAFVALARTKPDEAFSIVERQMSISVLITAHAFFES